jgi:hypothetical protein
MGYKKTLKKYGIDEENADEVMDWAFGEFWDVMDVRVTNLSFNSLHPELDPILNTTTIDDGLKYIADQWLVIKAAA